MAETPLDNKAGFSDTDLIWVLEHVDERDPLTRYRDEQWVQETVYQIIQRRKDGYGTSVAKKERQRDPESNSTEGSLDTSLI